MKRKYVVAIHIAIWLLLMINDCIPLIRDNPYYSYQGAARGWSLYGKYILITIGFTSIYALCFYGTYLVVAPPLFLRKQYVKAVLMAVLLLAALVGWRYTIEYGFFKPVLGFDNYMGRRVTVSDYVHNVFWYYFPKYFLYGLMYFFGEHWFQQRQRQEALQREKMATELAFLRSQINPHFLFNTINDIYALTYQQSEQAPEALLKLSELLRYMLREGAGDLVPLQREIDYLHNLVELQRIGAKGNAYIDFEIEGYVGDQQVASLLFVSFVENAFKHGVLTDAAHPVRIYMQASAGQVVFSVTNRKNDHKKDSTPGIGLVNVRRRLELLYPGKHTLQIKDEFDHSIQLTLQLS